PEGAGGVAVAVVADEVPAASVGDDAPGLDGAGGVRIAAGRPVREAHRVARVDGGQQDSQHVLGAAQAGQDGGRGDCDAGVGRVDVDAGGAQFEQCALGGGDELGGFPELGGDGDGGGLIAGELNSGQGVGVAVDAVALGGVELGHSPGC